MTTTSTNHPVRLHHRFDAPLDRLFEAWSDPAQLAAWAWGSLGNATDADVDFRVGGFFCVKTTRPDGETWSYSGNYTEIEPNARIVHTVIWDAPMGYDRVDEVLVATFGADAGGSTIELLHTGLPDEACAEEHRRGWQNVLETLGKCLEEWGTE